MFWSCSQMFCDTFKKASVSACWKWISWGWWPPSCEKPSLSSLPDWHTCSVKETAPNGTNSVWMWHVSEWEFLSKALISGPQISCHSSAGDRHRIREKKAVPNKSTTCQSHTQSCSQKLTRLHWDLWLHGTPFSSSRLIHYVLLH